MRTYQAERQKKHSQFEYRNLINKFLKANGHLFSDIKKEKPPCLRCKKQEFLKCLNDLHRECRAFIRFTDGNSYIRADIAEFEIKRRRNLQ